jgi:hypothetical protein
MTISADNNQHQKIAALWWMSCEDHANLKNRLRNAGCATAALNYGSHEPGIFPTDSR